MKYTGETGENERDVKNNYVHTYYGSHYKSHFLALFFLKIYFMHFY